MTAYKFFKRLAKMGQAILLACCLVTFFSQAGLAKTQTKDWWSSLESQWGGHVKFRANITQYDDDTIYGLVGTDPYLDGYTEFRLKNQTFFNDQWSLKTHYELSLSGGDKRRKNRELQLLLPPGTDFADLDQTINDDRRLMNLTWVMADEKSFIAYHRLDRLVVSYTPNWGSVKLGRQAVTWGNGLLFNPMDLFNPFAPTDFERDYKIADDLLLLQKPFGQNSSFQFILVPRRNINTHNLEADQSSGAIKLHTSFNTTEMDLMLARHYGEWVAGIGGTGYLADAAWRLDITYTSLKQNTGYLSLVANMDYSWVAWDKNFYGFIEFYFNGLSEDDYQASFTDPEIYDRLNRGELYALGRTYLSANLQVELHPLFTVYCTIINNLADPSGALQPRAIWNTTQNTQLTFGANIAYGAKDTEYGGFQIPNSPFYTTPASSGYIWWTYYF